MLLKDRIKQYRLLLASKSPRRRALLEGCGLEFEIAEGREADETFPADMPALQVAEYLSGIKSDAWAEELAEGDLLITADTVVIAGGEILGKPHDKEDAVRMLRLLSGADHEVVTGVTLRTINRRRSFSCSSRVTFRTITDEEIDYYVDTYRPYDKAGAYGIQEWIGYVAITGIEGSFYNVMGLPVQRLWVELDEFV
ncbi:MAG: septum formation protein Maf [Tidjanibacter sp.]|nr:septum formation protein Maf [Tidjanibacter sp.]